MVFAYIYIYIYICIYVFKRERLGLAGNLKEATEPSCQCLSVRALAKMFCGHDELLQQGQHELHSQGSHPVFLH